MKGWITAFLFSLLISFITAALFIHIVAEDNSESKDLHTFASLTTLQDAPPSDKLLKDDGSYHIGRWKQPFKDITFAHELEEQSIDDQDMFSQFLTRARNFMRLKRWQYLSVSDDKFFVAFALVQFNYVSDAFVYVVKKEHPQIKYEFTGRFPLGLNLQFPKNSAQGCGFFARSLLHPEEKAISICFDEKDRLYRVELNVPVIATKPSGVVEERQLIASFAAKEQESLILSFPLKGSEYRPAYVHKSAGMDANGVIKFGKEEHYLDGLAAIDWTKSMALRETSWNWVSVCGEGTLISHIKDPKTGQVQKESASVHFGINLSARVYDLPGGHSTENAIWINHTVYPLRGVTFTMPKEILSREWKVQSISSDDPTDHVDLTFTPKGAREDHTNLGLVVSEFVQPFGFYKGSVRVKLNEQLTLEVVLDDVFGVVEDHRAVW